MIHANTNNPLIDTTKLKAPKRRWSKADLEFLPELIRQGFSIEVISVKLGRSESSISSKGYKLGYRHKKTSNGLKYFTENINLKHRRAKDEIKIMKESKPIPISQEVKERSDNEVDTVIIPKIEINLVDHGMRIQINIETKK